MVVTAFPNGISSRGMPVLGGGSLELFSTGSVFFVDSVTGSDTQDGLDPSSALATIDAAINKCTADKGDLVIVMPNQSSITI